MPGPTVTKRPGRRAYYAWIDGRYVSTGQNDQRTAIQVAARMEAVGVEAYRAGKRSLSDRLSDLIEEHLAYLRDSDRRGSEHLRKKRQQLMRPVDAGVMRLLRDVTRRRFEPWWSSLACRAKTRNEYLTAWLVFLDWLVYEDRLDENPLRGRIRRARVVASESGKRRALTLAELEGLIAAGGRNALLYQTAASTGARRKELRLLLWAEVHETAEPPYLVLRPKNTKNAKGRTLYLSPELASDLAESRTIAKTDRVFRTMPSHHTVDKDLASAGIPKQTDEGTVSFHSLRHTFTTLIARQTKDARLAQRMADHADITTTQRYLHTEKDEHAAVMRDFPALRATGRASDVVQTGLSVSQRGAAGRVASDPKLAAREPVRPTESGRVSMGRGMEPGGIEPPCRNSQPQASTRVSIDCVLGLPLPQWQGVRRLSRQCCLTPAPEGVTQKPARNHRPARYRALQAGRANLY